MKNKIKIDIARKKVNFTDCAERWEIFAPSWILLMSYKDGVIGWDEYVECYYQEMREAFEFDPDAFYEMAKRLKKVEFICYCNNKNKQDEKCHRFLLTDILNKLK